MTRLPLIGLFLSLSALSAGDWPQFRGPNGDGVLPSGSLPTEFSPKEHLEWAAKIPGQGWSSPVVRDGKIFLTTAVSEKGLMPKNFSGGIAGMKDKGRDPGKFKWQVLCLDPATGKQLWAATAAEAAPKFKVHPSNSFATESPVAFDGGVCAYFGMAGVVAAFDPAGKELWRKDVGSYPTSNDFGTAASLALLGDSIFLQCDNEKESFLAAYEAKTGKELWKADRPVKTSWASPFVWKNKTRTELVGCGGGLVISYDPKTGKELWRLGGFTGAFSSTPAATDELLFFGNSGPMSVGPLFAVKAGAKGDITLKEGEKSGEFVAWYLTGSGPGMASPVVVGKHLYVVTRAGLACYVAATGEQVYKERLPKAKTIVASPIVADGKIFILDEEGDGFIVAAGPKFEILGEPKLEGLFWSSPSVGGGLLIREAATLFKVALPK